MGNCVGAPKRNPNNPISIQELPNDSADPIVNAGSSSRNDHDSDNLNDQSASDRNGDVPTTTTRRSSESNNNTTNPPTMNGRLIPSLKVFTLAELKLATGEFRTDAFLGEGSFGEVFKGWIDKKTYAPSIDGVGMAIAIKKSKFPYSCQGPKEGKVEVQILAKFSHPNLVKLLGFCWEKDQFLLVYEFMPKGSLDKHLFMRSVEALSWDIRLKIAIGAARGLAFLHNSEESVIYRDFKTSNILLDEEYNAKISDFGLAKVGPKDGKSHVTTRILGTRGYAAPEFVVTGHLYKKSDVYGFGVVLLEMLTGRRAIDEFRPMEEVELVKWADRYIKDKKKLKKIMDQRLENHFPKEGAWQAALLVGKCLQFDRKNRPSMQEVLGTLENIKCHYNRY